MIKETEKEMKEINKLYKTGMKFIVRKNGNFYAVLTERAKEQFDASQYKAPFAALEETDERQAVTFSLPTDAIDGLKRMAAQTGKSQSVIITELIRSSL